MPWVYLLECRDGSFYVGSTIDLERRVSDHQLGLGAAYTRHRRPVRLVWAADFHRVDEAFAFEKQVQGWGRAKRRARWWRADSRTCPGSRAVPDAERQRAMVEGRVPPPMVEERAAGSISTPPDAGGPRPPRPASRRVPL